MFDTILEFNHQVTVSGSFEAISNVCAKPPAGVSTYADQIIGWVKWAVIVTILACGFGSCGAMVVGKVASNGRAAQVGSAGLFWSILAAIAFAVIYGILTAITGTGC